MQDSSLIDALGFITIVCFDFFFITEFCKNPLHERTILLDHFECSGSNYVKKLSNSVVR